MKRIIVLEDDASLRELYKIILEKAGYAVTLFADGKDIIADRYQLPDLFLLDKQLPGLDGLLICKLLKRQPATRYIPVIIVSANVDLHSAAKEAGADAYIQKPFERKFLLDIIAEKIMQHEKLGVH